jgi:para-aminobenzoate synthetase component 1
MNPNFQHIVENEKGNFFYLNIDEYEYLGVGIKDDLIISESSDLKDLDDFIAEHSGAFIFCSFSYDLKTLTHQLPSKNKKFHDFPLAHLVVTQKLHKYQSEKSNAVNRIPSSLGFDILNKERYLDNLERIKSHLKLGDIYETNYCVNPCINKKINPLETYKKLNAISQAPFSGIYGYMNQYLICSSPERFLKKEGNRLISQPIKGTIKRGRTVDEDKILEKKLLNDPKETAENIMIVDLVRNDLSQIAKRNSVHVDALNEIQTFQTVHQLVSTISCELKDGTNFSEILQALFPMGSMTGAPKKRAMELMEELEDFQRGMYSGSIGYIDEKGNFDLNVVIRSILYNAETENIQFPVGGAITFKSNPISEFDECVLKAQSMLQAIVDGE